MPQQLRIQALSSPYPSARELLYLLLLGISGNTQDAAALEQHLQAIRESRDNVALKSSTATARGANQPINA